MVTPRDLALEAPHIHTTPDSAFGRESRLFQGIPGIERTRGGRLWVTWYAGGPDQPGEGPGNYVVLAVSEDEGESWREPALIIAPGAPLRAYDPCLWIDPLNRLWLFWAQSEGWYDGRTGVWCIRADHPEDPRPEWSAPRRLCDGIMMNKPTVLSSGEWILPVSIWPHTGSIHNLQERTGAWVVVSQDDGETWTRRGRALSPSRTFDEHMVIARRDGTLWMLIRTELGIAESVSDDQGWTWTEGRLSTIRHVNSRFFIRRLMSGRLLAVTHHLPQASDSGEARDLQTRSHLTAWLSDDDGCSWYGGLLLDDRKDISYPDGTQGDTGEIYLVYDRERTGAKEILMARVTEKEIASGAVENDRALRVRIS